MPIIMLAAAAVAVAVNLAGCARSEAIQILTFEYSEYRVPTEQTSQTENHIEIPSAQWLDGDALEVALFGLESCPAAPSHLSITEAGELELSLAFSPPLLPGEACTLVGQIVIMTFKNIDPMAREAEVINVQGPGKTSYSIAISG